MRDQLSLTRKTQDGLVLYFPFTYLITWGIGMLVLLLPEKVERLFGRIIKIPITAMTDIMVQLKAGAVILYRSFAWFKKIDRLISGKYPSKPVLNS